MLPAQKMEKGVDKLYSDRSEPGYRGDRLRECLRLYAVTDHRWLRGRSLESAVEEAILGGATMIQLRDKNMTEADIIAEAVTIRRLCERYQVPFIVNDSAEIALACGADGVHVGQDDDSITYARAVLGPGAVIGATAHNVEEAVRAEQQGADYLGCGAAFGSATKKDARPIDRAEYRRITSAVHIPVVAIGGITEDNIAGLAGAGLSGAAVVSAIFAAEDIRSAAERLRIKADALTGDL